MSAESFRFYYMPCPPQPRGALSAARFARRRKRKTFWETN